MFRVKTQTLHGDRRRLRVGFLVASFFGRRMEENGEGQRKAGQETGNRSQDVLLHVKGLKDRTQDAEDRSWSSMNTVLLALDCRASGAQKYFRYSMSARLSSSLSSLP